MSLPGEVTCVVNALFSWQTYFSVKLSGKIMVLFQLVISQHALFNKPDQLYHFVLSQQNFRCLNFNEILCNHRLVTCCFLQKWPKEAGNDVMCLSRYAENKLETTESFQQLSVLSPSVLSHAVNSFALVITLDCPMWWM